MAYSTQEQLLLGNIPLPAGNKARNAIDRAADEIDSMLGFLYQTPIVATGPKARAVEALMTNLNNWLASGRLGQELTASTQRTEIHAYFAGLVAQAIMTLNKIIAGAILLDGVPSADGTAVQLAGPAIYNKDDESNVDAFYDRLVSPPTYPAEGFYLNRIFGPRGPWC